MRRASALLALAWLGLACLVASPVVSPAAAQEIAVGGGVRVEGAASTRVNVRTEPRIAAGNVVGQVSGGALLRVQEARQADDHIWYRVASLPTAATDIAGWIRGDLLRPAALPAERTLPELLAEPESAGQASDGMEDGRAPVPFDQRTDWSRDLLALYPAIAGCDRVSSAPPVTVLRATSRSRTRDLVEVVMSDAAGRRWSCLIDAGGGTPIRYDPLSGTVFMRDRLATEPFFRPTPERPALDPNCYRLERVERPSDSEHLGWLYYRTCP